MTSGKTGALLKDDSNEAVYLIFNGDAKSDVQKIPVHDIALIDVREKGRNNLILSLMLIATILCGILVACEITFDVTWISDGMLEVLCSLCVLLVTSSVWYIFIKRYEVLITFNSGEKRFLE